MCHIRKSHSRHLAFPSVKTDVIGESVRTVGALVLSRSDQPGSASQVRSANIIRVKYPLLRRPRMWRPAKRNESSKRSPSQVQVGSDESFASPFVRWLQHASPRMELVKAVIIMHHACEYIPTYSYVSSEEEEEKRILLNFGGCPAKWPG